MKCCHNLSYEVPKSPECLGYLEISSKMHIYRGRHGESLAMVGNYKSCI